MHIFYLSIHYVLNEKVAQHFPSTEQARLELPRNHCLRSNFFSLKF